jgi:hypothetical protein
MIAHEMADVIEEYLFGDRKLAIGGASEPHRR